MSVPFPALPQVIPQRGSALWRWIGRSLMRITGWRVQGAFPEIGTFVIAVAPHTSNWDFVHGAAAMFALDIRITFIGKHTLFVWPFAAFLRWMGGIPVDRTRPNGVVGEAVAWLRAAPGRVLVIAPEGTRKKVQRYKTGFLHIARGAGVPVLLVGLDYPARAVRIGPLIEIGEDIDAERRRVEAHFANIPGRHAQ